MSDSHPSETINRDEYCTYELRESSFYKGLRMAAHPRIEDFGIERELLDNYDRRDYRFLSRWADVTSLAQNSQTYCLFDDKYETVGVEGVDGTYTVNIAERTMVVFGLFLQTANGNRRFTKMSGSQVLVDCWLTGGGSQPAGTREQFRYLGINDIIEARSEASIEKEIDEQTAAGTIQNPPEGPVEIMSTSPNWATNTWISVAVKTATGLSTPTRQITVSRVWIVEDNCYNLVVEFTLTAVEDPAAADQAAEDQAAPAPEA